MVGLMRTATAADVQGHEHYHHREVNQINKLFIWGNEIDFLNHLF